MIIKYHNDCKPLKSLEKLLDTIDRRAKQCKNSNHKFISLIYISSFIFSDTVMVSKRKLSQVLKQLEISYEPDLVCLIRTVSPNCIPRYKYHRSFIESLRDCCPIIVYDSKKEFLNHAKFLVWIHACFDEGNIYKSLYYGSTNFTCRGLAVDSRGKGNFEEYCYYNVPKRYPFNRMSSYVKRSLQFYLREIKDQLQYVKETYDCREYVKNIGQILCDHLRDLKDIIDMIERMFRGTLLDIYKAYIQGHSQYLSTLALLDQLPGKRLTQNIALSLIKLKRPISPLMLEEMSISYEVVWNKEIGNMIAKYYGEGYLRKELENLRGILRKAHKLLVREYLKNLKMSLGFIKFLEKHGDPKELALMERISNLKKTIINIEELLEVIRYR